MESREEEKREEASRKGPGLVAVAATMTYGGMCPIKELSKLKAASSAAFKQRR